MNDYQRLRFDIYEQELLQQINNSKLSFNEIDTPGWSSMVQQSHVMTDNQNFRSRNSFEMNESKNIKFDGKDINNLIYFKSKTKRESCPLEREQEGDKNRSPLCILEKQNQQDWSYKPKIGLKQRIQMKLQGLSIDSSPCSSIVRSDYSTTEDLRAKKNQSKSKLPTLNKPNSHKMMMRSNSSSQISRKIKQNPMQKKLQLNAKDSRFKEITVHEHLYQTSKKLEQKKEIKKILDDKFHSVFVAPFQPVINLKSSRMADKINSGEIEPKKSKEEQTLTTIPEQKIKEKQSKREEIDKDQLQFFNYLSQDTGLVTEEGLNKSLEDLPLPCVSLLANFIKTIYSGKNYDFPAFQETLRNKKVIANRQKLLKCFNRWHNA